MEIFDSNGANSEGKMDYRKKLQKHLSCPFCPPNKVENQNRNCQHYKKKKNWKYQTKIKKQYDSNKQSR